MNAITTRTSRLGVATITALLFSLVPVTAASRRVPTLQERLTGAARVVVATARHVETNWETNQWGDRIIASRVLLEVSETLKGNNESSLWMKVPGGTVGDITLRVSGQPVVRDGERAVFFLEAAKNGAHAPFERGAGVLKLDAQDHVAGTTVSVDNIRQLAHSLSN